MASEIGALCHVLRDTDVFSAFTEVALLGTILGKALKPQHIRESQPASFVSPDIQ